MPTLFLLIFLYLNFHFLLVLSHSCNSLARKYPRKGKLPSYINSLVNTKKGDSWGTLGGFSKELVPGDPSYRKDERLGFSSLGVRKSG